MIIILPVVLLCWLPYILCTTKLPLHCGASDAVVAKNRGKQPRIAVGFYGISRNLPLVLPSIEKNIFETLQEADILFDVFSSTLSAQSLHNKRSHENGHLNMFDVELLRPCYFTIACQETIQEDRFKLFMKYRNLTKKDVASTKKPAPGWDSPAEAAIKYVTGKSGHHHHHNHFDAWSDDFASVKNLLSAFHSLKSLHNLIVKVSTNHGIEYDAVMALRIDTAQIVRTDVATFLSNNKAVIDEGEKVIALPDFQHWGGFNDRMAFGPPVSMAAYLTRGDWYINNSYPMTGEVFLKAFLHRENISVHWTNMRCLRVRVDGQVAKEDLERDLMNLPESAAAEFNHCIGKDNKIRPYSC